jgi:hypothetical protein
MDQIFGKLVQPWTYGHSSFFFLVSPFYWGGTGDDSGRRKDAVVSSGLDVPEEDRAVHRHTLEARRVSLVPLAQRRPYRAVAAEEGAAQARYRWGKRMRNPHTPESSLFDVEPRARVPAIFQASQRANFSRTMP